MPDSNPNQNGNPGDDLPPHDPDIVEIDDEDLGSSEAPRDAEPSSGEPGGVAGTDKPAQQGFILYDGERWPAEFKDGQWVPGAALSKYMQAAYVPRDRYDRDIGNRSSINGNAHATSQSEQADPAKVYKDRITAIRAEPNPHDPDEDPREFHAFEMARRDRIDEVKDEAAEARSQILQQRIEARERQEAQREAQSEFEREFDVVAKKVGVPKGDTDADKGLRKVVEALTGMDPRLKGYSSDAADAVEMSVITQYWWEIIQKAVDAKAAAISKSVKESGKNATVAVHKGGSPSVAPIARQSPAARTPADYEPAKMRERILANAVARTAARGRP